MRKAILISAMMIAVLSALGQSRETPLSDAENAYNPVPSPDGTLIAFVRIGWGREGGSRGFGRSNLRSEVALMTVSGESVSKHSAANAFLTGWTPDGEDLVCYRDWRFHLVPRDNGDVQTVEETGGDRLFMRSERASYLSKSHTFVWVEQYPRTTLLTQSGTLAETSAMTGTIVVPSPDERYLAIAGNGMDLWVYDTNAMNWTNLGKVDIHPDSDWDYIKPSWNPWFTDSSRLTFVSASSLVIASPDGRQRTVIPLTSPAGLAVPSPDGTRIAYVTFSPRPMKLRPDLNFWGGTAIWTVVIDAKAEPQQITTANDDATYDLKWLGADKLVFDRISDTALYSHARLWIVNVGR